MVTNSSGKPGSHLPDPRNGGKLKFIHKVEKGTILTALLVGAMSFFVFLTSLRGEFVNMDDDVYIYNNSFIDSFDARFFKWAFGSFYVSNWHPLTWISHGVDYALWGLNPLGHHLSNNLLHAANAFLVVLVVMRLLASWQAGRLTSSHNSTPSGKSGTLPNESGKHPDFPHDVDHSPFTIHRSHLIVAGVTGLLFGIHPVHVESVAWVSERKDVLCAFFFLLSLYAYLGYADGGGKDGFRDRRYLVSLGFFVLALLSKPMAVTLPAVLLILDWYPLGRIRSWGAIRGAIVEKLPFIVVSVASSVMTILAQGAEAQSLETFPLFTRLIVGAFALVSYLWKMVLPLNLNPFYPYPPDVSLSSLKYLMPVLLVMAITAAAGLVARRQRIWLAVWGYYVITLLPVLGIIQIGNQSMADRYVYLPSLGPFLIAAIAFSWLYEKARELKKRRLAISLTGVSALAAFVSISYLTIAQIEVWKDEFTLWNHVIAQEPGKTFFAYNNRGIAYSNRGNYDKAVEDYNTAIAMKPDYFRVYNNRGVVFSRTGLYEKAIEDFSRAIGLHPNFDDAYNNRGIAYEKTGQFEKAMEDFQKAIVLNPFSEKAYINRGVTYQKAGMLDEAIKDFNAAIYVNPNSHTAYNNRGICFYKKGLLNRAIEDYTRAIAINPYFKEAYYNRGLSFNRMGFSDRALQDFRRSGAE